MDKGNLNKLVTNYPVELTPEEVENLSQTLSSVRTAREDDKTYTGEGFVNVNNTNNKFFLNDFIFKFSLIFNFNSFLLFCY